MARNRRSGEDNSTHGVTVPSGGQPEASRGRTLVAARNAKLPESPREVNK
jgi:hypothetical protein